jgi:membrane protease YdiL (CAAX protease family)
MSEKRYPSKYCPYCATPFSTPSQYCETCGAEKLWTITELQPTPYPWSPTTSYLITVLTYGLFTLLTAAMFYYLVYFGIPLPLIFEAVLNDPRLTAILTFSELVFILIPVGYVLSRKISLKKLGIASGGLRTFITDISLGLVAGAAFVPLIIAIASYEIFGMEAPPTPLPGSSDLFWVGVTLLTIVFIVAPAEELLFRGFLQNSLDANYGRIGGVLVASVIFGIVHANPLIGVYQTIIGIFLGLLFQWRGRRLAAPIAAHAIYDCILILLNVFVF